MAQHKPMLQFCRFALYISAAFAPLFTCVGGQTTAEPSDPVCVTGPTTMQESNSIFVNGRQYLSDSGEVTCDGHIISWSFCHYVIGFRHLEMELWAGAWRLEGDTYQLVGLNKIVLQPPGYDGEQLRCVDHEVDPFDWIFTREGDYIGFYLPENGVFVASASPASDPDHQQLQRIGHGFLETFNASQVEVAAASTGRALLRAEIGEHIIVV